MATDKQTAANRQNAQKSTGPKTPEGRAAARLNSLKHGLTAKTLVLPGESEEDFNTSSIPSPKSTSTTPPPQPEDALVTQLAMATWRLRRLYHQEAGFYTRKSVLSAPSPSRRSKLGLLCTPSHPTPQPEPFQSTLPNEPSISTSHGINNSDVS